MTNENYNSQINAGTRIATMLLDHVFMTVIAMVFFVPGIVGQLTQDLSASNEMAGPGFMYGPLGYIGLFGFALYFCKDIINGRSIAKRILKLQLVDNKTGQVAGPIQCFIRNILCVLWPIEAIIAII